MTRSTVIRNILCISLLTLAPAPAAVSAQLVFANDPVDPSTGQAYSILPGVPLVYPGPDARFGTADDVIDSNLIGDVDLVVRTVLVIGNVIPPPASGIGAAPSAIAGGLLGGEGSQAPFVLVFSDGAATPAAGHPLFGSELDLRRALVVAYADLDGDGFIGPTASTTAPDLEVRRQEALTFAGRTMAEFSGGVASGRIGVSLALPASAGGLGIVVGAGAATGATPNLYADGPWVTTSLPYMIPLEQGAVVGGEATGPLDPISLVDLELAGDQVYLPPPNHPLIGTPYAIPLDGTNVSVDLVRSISGSMAGVAFARPVDRASFTAQWARVIKPALGSQGERLLVEPLDAVSMDADGAASAQSMVVFPADLLGNDADPPAGGQTVVLEVGPALRITAPDADGDPQRETINFVSARAVALVIDDRGASGADAVLATCAGVPCGVLAVTVSGGSGPAAAPFGSLWVRIRHGGEIGAGVVKLAAQWQAGTQSIDPSTQDLLITLTDAAGPIFARTVPAGSLHRSRRGNAYRLSDASTILKLRLSRDGKWKLALRANELTLPAGGTLVTATLQVGAAMWRESRTCLSTRLGVRRCGP